MASPSVTCYPQPNKAKSRLLCEAFARGARGVVDTSGQLQPGPAAFYGTVGLEPLFRQAQGAGDWYYLDNAYFDRARGTHFRAGKNALQGRGKPDWLKFGALKLGVQPWTRSGRHVLVIEQSDYFMREVARWPGGLQTWRQMVLETLGRSTDRMVVVRHWQRDKAERARTLHEELKGAWALVTHASAAANEALVAGVPVFLTGPGAAMVMGSSELENIERPRRPDGRMEYCATLAGAQWTVEEIENGDAWRALNEA